MRGLHGSADGPPLRPTAPGLIGRAAAQRRAHSCHATITATRGLGFRMLRRIALVPSSQNIDLGEVTRTAAALQTQVLRDLRPLWKCQASVAAYASLADVPIGYWPILVTDDVGGPGSAGMHLDQFGNPYCI